MMFKLVDWVHRLSNIQGVIAGVCLLVLALLITAGVVARYVLQKPLLFSDEFSTYLALSLIFLALGYSFRVRAHIAVNVVERLLPDKLRHIVMYVGLSIGLIFSVILLAGGIDFCITAYTRRTVATTVMQTPLIFPAIIIPLGVAQMTLQLAAQILRTVGGPQRRRTKPQK